jgi:hypothetical protein
MNSARMGNPGLGNGISFQASVSDRLSQSITVMDIILLIDC